MLTYQRPWWQDGAEPVVGKVEWWDETWWRIGEDEVMDRCEFGIFGKIQLKVNKKLGNVEIKAYFCRLNKYITLKIRRLWQ